MNEQMDESLILPKRMLANKRICVCVCVLCIDWKSRSISWHINWPDDDVMKYRILNTGHHQYNNRVDVCHKLFANIGLWTEHTIDACSMEFAFGLLQCLNAWNVLFTMEAWPLFGNLIMGTGSISKLNTMESEMGNMCNQLRCNWIWCSRYKCWLACILAHAGSKLILAISQPMALIHSLTCSQKSQCTRQLALKNTQIVHIVRPVITPVRNLWAPREMRFVELMFYYYCDWKLLWI